MDQALKAEWIEALRSGGFKQARYKLRDRNKLCCIGVGHAIRTGEKPSAKLETLSVAHSLGLDQVQCTALVDMNDYDEKNFAEIADYIEANF